MRRPAPAKVGEILCMACLEESGDNPSIWECAHFPFPQGKQGRVVPLLFPKGFRPTAGPLVFGAGVTYMLYIINILHLLALHYQYTESS